MTEIGHNNPPESLELASDVASSISAYMADNPVVETEDAARGMKAQIDRAKLCIKDLEAERDTKVRPLNERVATINHTYRRPRRLIGDLLDEMLGRVQTFVKFEERRRQEIARIAAEKALEAERKAREAELIERQKLDDASKGEVGVDVASAISEADEAFEAFERAERQAALAQKDTKVRVGGGFSRAIGLREKETLKVTDHLLAIRDIGFTADMEDAVLKAARAYRKLHGSLPRGIQSAMEREL